MLHIRHFDRVLKVTERRRACGGGGGGGRQRNELTVAGRLDDARSAGSTDARLHRQFQGNVEMSLKAAAADIVFVRTVESRSAFECF